MYWRFSERWKDRESYNQYILNGYLVVVSIFIPYIILAATLHFLYANNHLRSNQKGVRFMWQRVGACHAPH